MERITGRVVFTLLFTVFALLLSAPFGAAPHAAAAVYTAATCNRSDVNAVINGPTHTAVDGDTIQIPSGSCTWTSGITVPSGVGITIRGTGTGYTTSSVIGASASCTATTITDNSNSGLFRMRPAAMASLSRLSCLKIRTDNASAITAPLAAGGTCNSTTCSNLRIDNVTFDNSLQGMVWDSGSLILIDNIFGVIDHNTVTAGDGSGATVGMEFVAYNNTAWGGVGAYGDNSWASADSFGTSRTLYVENNAFGAGVVIGEDEADVPFGGRGGGRIVVRFNTCDGCLAGISGHGTESNGRLRGVRQVEFYGNSYRCINTSSGCQGAVPIRSGVSLTFGNTLTAAPGSWFQAYVNFATYRTLQPFNPWGVCDGSSAYDTNDLTTYASGTVTSVSASSTTTTITDNTKTWTASQWIPSGAAYGLHNVTRNTGAQITANGTTTVSVKGWTGPPDFRVGDNYQILRSMACIDQPNRSGGTLYSGATPSPASSSAQTLNPAYEWNDSGANPVFGNVALGDGSFDARMIANRDWYTDNSHGSPQAQTSQTSPFNGSSGIGFGTLANRPTTCTPRVGYWATDQGSWNQSGNSFGQGNLYVCTATNTWTLYYTPYTYPHPLISGITTVSPSAPTNLRIISQ